MKRPIRLVIGVLVIGLLVILGNLHLRRDSTPAATSDEPGVSQNLYEAARDEGTVRIWATNIADVSWIPAAFTKTYPGITIDIYTDLNISARVITEAAAGRHDVDVIWNSEALVQPLIDRGLLALDEWAQLGVSNDDIGADGYMAITSSVAFAVAYRKDLVTPDQVPMTWSDLSAAKYRGKLAASPFLFARLCAALGAFEGKEKLFSYARQLRNESQTLWTNDLLEQTVISGERPFVVAVPNHQVEQWKARGLPVEIVLPEPVFVTQFGSVVLSKAPHPNAARLLATWLSSPEGRVAREQAIFAVDLRPSSIHPIAQALRESGKLLYVDTKEAMEVRNTLIPELDRILSGMN